MIKGILFSAVTSFSRESLSSEQSEEWIMSVTWWTFIHFRLLCFERCCSYTHHRRLGHYDPVIFPFAAFHSASLKSACFQYTMEIDFFWVMRKVKLQSYLEQRGLLFSYNPHTEEMLPWRFTKPLNHWTFNSVWNMPKTARENLQMLEISKPAGNIKTSLDESSEVNILENIIKTVYCRRTTVGIRTNIIAEGVGR